MDAMVTAPMGDIGRSGMEMSVLMVSGPSTSPEQALHGKPVASVLLGGTSLILCTSFLKNKRRPHLHEAINPIKSYSHPGALIPTMLISSSLVCWPFLRV